MFSKFSSYPPIKSDINNRTLKGQKAMPLKNDNADGTSVFSMGRHAYVETVGTLNNSVAIQLKKKYLGGNNRDASSIIANKKRNQIGYGSVNASGQNISFSSTSDTTTQNSALSRVRAGGYMVPKKFTTKYVAYVDAVKNTVPLVYNNRVLILCELSLANSGASLLRSELITLMGINPNEVIRDIAIKSLSDYNGILYDGADLIISNYSVIILITDNPVTTGIKTVYHPLLGKNLNNYIASGGNMIMGSHSWQNNNPMPGFIYAHVPFLYNNKYTTASTNLASLIYKPHPITNGLGADIMMVAQDIITNIYQSNGARTIATTTNNIPFISVLEQGLLKSRTIAINGQLGVVSPSIDANGNHINKYSKLIYNCINWCLKVI